MNLQHYNLYYVFLPWGQAYYQGTLESGYNIHFKFPQFFRHSGKENFSLINLCQIVFCIPQKLFFNFIFQLQFIFSIILYQFQHSGQQNIFFNKKDFIQLVLDRGKGKKRGRETSMYGLPLMCPLLGTYPLIHLPGSPGYLQSSPPTLYFK